MAAVLGASIAGVLAVPAIAVVPLKEITSSGPLTSVTIGNELGCQVSYRGDTRFELFPASAKPGDCGTFVAVNGTLFAPAFGLHGGTATSSLGAFTPFTPVTQSDVSGQGSSASPFRVTTTADAGGLRITEIDTYVTGQESYRTDVTIANRGAAAASGVLYRAGDCYLQESDTGFGFLDVGARAVGCSINANNSPAARIEQWYPITSGNQYMEARYAEVWAQIATKQPLPNTTRATEAVDNGAGISWNFSVAAGRDATFSHYTTFSPQGVAGPPPAATPPAATPPAVTPPAGAFGPNGLLDAPSARRCVSRRFFRIRLRRRYWPIIVGVTVRLPLTTRVLRRPPWGTIVDLRGLPKGRFIVRITALTTTGRTIKGKRNYRTCRGRLRGGRPKL